MKLPYLILTFCILVASCAPNKDRFAEVKSAINNEQLDQAMSLAKELFNGSLSTGDTIKATEALYYIARIHALKGDFEAALENAKAAQIQAMNNQMPNLEYKINNLISWSFFELGYGMKDTFSHQKRQMEVVEQLGDDQKKALVYNNYSYDGTVSGYIPLSRAISLMHFANDYYAREENNEGRWYTLMNLTWQYRLMNKLDMSAEHGRKSLKQAKKDEDRHAIIEAAANLGETLLVMNSMEQASTVYQEGLEWASKNENDRDYHVFQVYYSHYLWEINDRGKALNKIKAAIDYLSSGEVFYEMLARSYYAQYLLESGDLDAVKEQLSYFANPRGSYYSQEAEVLAAIVEAKIHSITDKKQAIELLQKYISDVDRSEAVLLKTSINKAIVSF